MSSSERRIKGLGEVSIRVKDFERMERFYEQVLGLEVLDRSEGIAFFRIAAGYGGQKRDRGAGYSSKTSF